MEQRLITVKLFQPANNASLLRRLLKKNAVLKEARGDWRCAEAGTKVTEAWSGVDMQHYGGHHVIKPALALSALSTHSACAIAGDIFCHLQNGAFSPSTDP